ncbi:MULTISPECIES: sigma 54-interacting transcriptional regulator [unclassified Kribbella]|uniref:sigma 54-interacting transcriptional regulator n=1 Tax=unclassified Kribbella TaxID=2644121 RepID=UPI00301A388D
MDAWIKVIGAPDAVVRTVTHGLEALDIKLIAPAPGIARNGLVVFGAATADVAAGINELAAGLPGRVLALSTTGGLQGDDSWGLLRAGASDVLTWRDPGESAQHIADRLRRWHTIDELVRCSHVQKFLVGDSAVWQAVLREAVEVARFTSAAVLITGESGTGKERVAELIHELDPRPGKGKMVVLDCSTVVPSLSGSEFFGHEKGAFTGASAARAGAFELADGGTLFLDEVGELPVPLQAELLRVIQEGTFKRVGSNLWRKSTFRLVCATNRDLSAARTEGSFRNDFYYRIAGSRLHLPSLRERTEDIVPLFRHFFSQVYPDREPPELEDAVRDLLLTRAYPGNVRDLRSLALQIVHRHLPDGFITVGDIPDHERPVRLDPETATRLGVAPER